MARKKSKKLETDIRLAKLGLKVLKWLLVVCVLLMAWSAFIEAKASVVIAGIILVPMLLYWHPGKR